MPIERRWKLSAAGMAKRSFRRVSGGQDDRNERPARWHGQRPGGLATISEEVNSERVGGPLEQRCPLRQPVGDDVSMHVG